MDGGAKRTYCRDPEGVIVELVEEDKQTRLLPFEDEPNGENERSRIRN